ncbi:MAG: ABC transporter ATP-binding protein [Chloroflexi bacterium]|nr:ABC transporter ATP-binding protein [Chloroflexota bacterium]
MAVIEFKHVSKAYRLGSHQTSLRAAIAHQARRLFRANDGATADELFWALDDVSFEIEVGEVVGVIGHNGAGKSTILKLLSKVTFPTEGEIHTRGRLASLIELGAGFHPDLSGRENMYLNGAILGLKRSEIDAQFSNMVEFAGLEKFIDTPVKRYSSGMYVRLAFAVAAHVKADLLLVDEVLSVGDLEFQQKCLTKMRELRDSGVTIVFISHNMWNVSTFCKRVLLLQSGQIKADGAPDEVIQIYRLQEREKVVGRANAAGTNGGDGLEAGEATSAVTVELLNQDGQPEREFSPEDHLRIRLHYNTAQTIQSPLFEIQIRRADGLICCSLASDSDTAFANHSIQGRGAFEVVVGPLQLVPDVYAVEAHLADIEQPIVYASSAGEIFRVTGHVSDPDNAGVFRPRVEWLPQRVTE